jgi:uncharacterized protein YbjT (DUF2867 family)
MIDSKTVITVFGGSGFVGRYIVRALAKTGARIRVAVRNPHTAIHTTTSGTVGQITPIFCNIRNYKSVEDALHGADIAINCVGILHPSGKQSFPAVQAQGAEHIAHAAMRLQLKRVIHLSAIGAAENSQSHYARSKGLGEQNMLRYFPKVTILRPSVIFGAEDNFCNRFAKMASLSPFLPLIGGGHTKFQPIYVGDVVDAVMSAINNEKTAGKIYEIGGSEILTFKQILEKICFHTKKPRLLLHVPFTFARIGAWFAEFLPNPAITNDQLILLEQDNIASPLLGSLRDLGVKPRTMDSILPTYLQRYQTAAPYNHARGYTLKPHDENI